MIEKDKKRLFDLATLIGYLNLLNIIGSTLHSKGILQEHFDTAMRESDVGLMSTFGCNTSNAVRNAERNIGRPVPTLDELSLILSEITAIINKNNNKIAKLK